MMIDGWSIVPSGHCWRSAAHEQREQRVPVL